MKAAQESQGVNLEREFEAQCAGHTGRKRNEKKRTAATLAETQSEEGSGCKNRWREKERRAVEKEITESVDSWRVCLFFFFFFFHLLFPSANPFHFIFSRL